LAIGPELFFDAVVRSFWLAVAVRFIGFNDYSLSDYHTSSVRMVIVFEFVLIREIRVNFLLR